MIKMETHFHTRCSEEMHNFSFPSFCKDALEFGDLSMFRKRHPVKERKPYNPGRPQRDGILGLDPAVRAECWKRGSHRHDVMPCVWLFSLITFSLSSSQPRSTEVNRGPHLQGLPPQQASRLCNQSSHTAEGRKGSVSTSDGSAED